MAYWPDNQGFEVNSANGEIGYITNFGKSEKRFYSDTLVAEKLTSASIDFIKENKKEPFPLFGSLEVHGPKSAKKTEYLISRTKKKTWGFQSLMQYALRWNSWM